MRSDLSKTAELMRTVLNNIHVEQMLKIVFKRGGVGAGGGGELLLFPFLPWLQLFSNMSLE